MGRTRRSVSVAAGFWPPTTLPTPPLRGRERVKLLYTSSILSQSSRLPRNNTKRAGARSRRRRSRLDCCTKIILRQRQSPSNTREGGRGHFFNTWESGSFKQEPVATLFVLSCTARTMSHRSRAALLVSVAPPLFIFVRPPRDSNRCPKRKGGHKSCRCRRAPKGEVDAAEGEVTLQSNKERSSEAVDCILIGQS